MAKTIEKEARKFLKTASPQIQVNRQQSSQKSKFESAMEYLNKFHPGWDVYLKAKDN
jgi:hypothetical protein